VADLLKMQETYGEPNHRTELRVDLKNAAKPGLNCIPH
jgi:hypothetical protein